ncbi:MAG: Jag N-terminal domain-containing protein [Arcobacteraceae bacterium]
MLKASSNNINTFEAKTLEEVYEKASRSLNCSITNLDIEIVQNPSKGFFGFFPKNAIISVQLKKQPSSDSYSSHTKIENKPAVVETLASRLASLNTEKNIKNEIPKMVNQAQKEKLFDDFYISKDEKLHELSTKKNSVIALEEKISLEINHLFSLLNYEIEIINVEIIDNNTTVFIEFSGKDSALLIGKEGYRYKALSYILFNWINEKYNMMLRLEVAQFLSNQESAIYAYLEPVIETIKKEGYFKTKVLDGILVHIALTKLREAFPDKYVAVKTTQKGEKYILVNEYRN